MEKSRAIDLLDNLIGMIEDNQDNDYDTAFRMAIDALTQSEIVRCGECGHKGTYNCIANILATLYGYEVKDDFYCGLAERRTDGEKQGD